MAKDLRVNALQCMASFMTSANGRNYYLTSALEEITGSKIATYDALKEFAVNNMPMDHIMAMLRVRLKVENVPDAWRNISICHDLEDSWYYLDIRDGVIEIFKGAQDIDYNHLDDITNSLMQEAYIERLVTREECHDKATLVNFYAQSRHSVMQ
eukprot:TRINITY_DN6269_c0_g1_i1.p1 TRINITY_DN6269_c0_g1~~TRINITY_DN6269_c0_g1_i1.p1  ORF type:complete len:154 (-),score=17.86 TRINITY_DN6269_c0_g1_i1:109-570(-)